jgi:hypothetical protein
MLVKSEKYRRNVILNPKPKSKYKTGIGCKGKQNSALKAKEKNTCTHFNLSEAF